MFCDQDDVWSADRISLFLGRIKRENPSDLPILLFTPIVLIDKDGREIGYYDEMEYLGRIKDQREFFFRDSINGCNMFMNKKLFLMPPEVDLSKEAMLIPVHDAYFVRFAAFFGRIIYASDKATLFYRRHGDNVSQISVERDSGLERVALAQSWAYRASLLTIAKF